MSWFLHINKYYRLILDSPEVPSDYQFPVSSPWTSSRPLQSSPRWQPWSWGWDLVKLLISFTWTYLGCWQAVAILKLTLLACDWSGVKKTTSNQISLKFNWISMKIFYRVSHGDYYHWTLTLTNIHFNNFNPWIW